MVFRVDYCMVTRQEPHVHPDVVVQVSVGLSSCLEPLLEIQHRLSLL